MKALRVLVIEDDALIAMLLSELLQGMGHDVCATAASEADAVAAATRCKPDLMIVDAACAAEAALPPSRKSSGQDRSRICSSAGMPRVRALVPDAVVVRKPFRQAELLKAIDTAFNAVAR